MGLLDSLFGPAPTTGLLSDPNAGLALVAGLLGAKKGEGLAGLGRGLLTGAQTYNQDQQQERANRQSDLQQLQGLYGVYKTKDLVQRVADDQMGVPHVEDPVLGQIEGKMMTMAGANVLSKTAPPGSSPPSAQRQSSATAPPALPAPAPQARPPSAASTPQNPQYNVPPQGFQQSAPQQLSPQDRMRREADLYAALANNPGLLAQNRYKLSIPTYSHGVAFDTGTGNMMGGVIGNLPQRYNPTTQSMETIPNDITPVLAAQKGAIASAEAAGRSGYEFREIPGTNRLESVDQMRANAGAPPNPYIPAWLQAQLRAPQAATNPPALPGSSPQVAQLTVTQPSRNLAGSYGNQGAGNVGPDPVTQAGQKAGAESINKTYGEAFGEIRKAGTDAPYQSALLKEMLALTQGALRGQTGTFMPMRQKWTEVLTSMGVPQKVIDSLPQTIQNLPQAQDFVKLAMQRAMSQTRTLGAREAASVFNQVQQANPQTGLTSDAMSRILQPLMAEQDWNAQKFQAADQWLHDHNGSLAGFEAQWQRENPFVKFWKNSEQVRMGITPNPNGPAQPPPNLKLPPGYSYVGPAS